MSTKITEAIASARIPFTKLEQRVATYLTGRPEALALETSAEIAEKLDVSPMTVSRFFKKLGAQNASVLRSEARRELYGPNAVRVGNRYKSYTQSRELRGAGFDQDVAHCGIQAALDLRESTTWKQAVENVSHSDSVMAVGFQLMQYMALGLTMRLKYVRSNVTYVEGADGIYAEVFADQSPRKTLIIIDTFRYAAHGPILAKAARQKGFHVILFCDEFCDWGQGVSDSMLIFPNEGHFFLPFPTGIHYGLNLFYQDVIDTLGDKAKASVEIMSKSQDLFGGFISK